MINEKFIDRLLNKSQELKIAELYSHGFNAKEISDQMDVSEKYVADMIEDIKFSERCEQEKHEMYLAG